MPVNACGTAPRAATAHAVNANFCRNPPAPRFLNAKVTGNSVTFYWSPTSEFESPYRTNLEIGTSPGASDVLITPHISSYGGPTFTTTLAPGRYYARARRSAANCDENSNPSPEITIVIP